MTRQTAPEFPNIALFSVRELCCQPAEVAQTAGLDCLFFVTAVASTAGQKARSDAPPDLHSSQSSDVVSVISLTAPKGGIEFSWPKAFTPLLAAPNCLPFPAAV